LLKHGNSLLHLGVTSEYIKSHDTLSCTLQQQPLGAGAGRWWNVLYLAFF